MWQNILQIWIDIWANPDVNRTVIGGAVAGFFSALCMFLVGDVFWKSHLTRIQNQVDWEQKRLQHLYAPLYQFYSEAYTKFDLWHEEHKDSKQQRQPFFAANNAELHIKELLSQYGAYASPSLIKSWSLFGAAENSVQKAQYRKAMLSVIIKDYQSIRRRLKLDFDRYELKHGDFVARKY